MVDDLDVLTRSVKDLCHTIVAHQFEKGSEVKTFRKGVDNEGHVRSSHLNDAQLRPKRGFAKKFRVHSNVVIGCKALAGGGEIFCFCNHMHGDAQLYPSSAALSPRNGIFEQLAS